MIYQIWGGFNWTKREIINHIVACANEFAHKHNLSSKESFRYLYKFNGIKFLKENYEAEHTLSFDTVVEDLEILCKRNECLTKD